MLRFDNECLASVITMALGFEHFKVNLKGQNFESKVSLVSIKASKVYNLSAERDYDLKG